MRDEPLRLDDAEPQSKPPKPTVYFAMMRSAFVALGLILAFLSLTTSAPTGATLAGLACFCGIMARICQAEDHHLLRFLVVGAALLGGSAVTTEAQEKKTITVAPKYTTYDPKTGKLLKTTDGKAEEVAAPFDATVRLEQYQGGALVFVAEGIPAYQRAGFWNIRRRELTDGPIRAGDRIIDKDKVVWVVTKAVYLEKRIQCEVKKADSPD